MSALPKPSVSPAHPARRVAPVSRANRSPKSAAVRRAHGWISHDPRDERAQLPARWSAFIRSEFRSREAVAAYFGVVFNTACNWWDGSCAPSSAALMTAYRQMPRAFAAWAEGW